MIFNRIRKSHPSMAVALFASLAFIALAVWGWHLPLEKVFQFLLICLVLVVVLIAAAALLMAVIQLVKRWIGRDKSDV